MSNLINKTRLQKFATDLWAKIKDRYDNAFVGAELTAAEKKIKFTKAGGGEKVEVDLADYARLQDRNEFKKDVSVNDAANINNTHIGTVNGAMSRNRFLAYRGLTSKSFVDGYVHSIIVYIAGSVQNDATSTWKVWAINKKQNKNSDTINTLLHSAYQGAVETLNIDGTDRKVVRIPVDRTFDEEVYFLLRTTTQDIQAMTQISPQYIEDVINVPHDQSSVPNTNVNYADNATSNTITMHLVGRESIKSLSEKIDKANADSSAYVKHTDCVTTGGTSGAAGKVVKLGTDGKLDNSLMPKIALNEYYEVREFTHAALGGITYENGDVVVVNNTGNPNNGKRYLCIKKDKNPRDLTEGFVELNAKDGVVTSVNELRGDISLALAAEEEKVKLNITSGGVVKTSELPVISTAEIDTIITSLS